MLPRRVQRRLTGISGDSRSMCVGRLGYGAVSSVQLELGQNMGVWVCACRYRRPRAICRSPCFLCVGLAWEPRLSGLVTSAFTWSHLAGAKKLLPKEFQIILFFFFFGSESCSVVKLLLNFHFSCLCLLSVKPIGAPLVREQRVYCCPLSRKHSWRTCLCPAVTAMQRSLAPAQL